MNIPGGFYGSFCRIMPKARLILPLPKDFSAGISLIGTLYTQRLRLPTCRTLQCDDRVIGTTGTSAALLGLFLAERLGLKPQHFDRGT